MSTFKEYYHKIKPFTEDLFLHPELGYKEFRTSKKILTELREINPKIKVEQFSETGIKTYLSKDKAKTMAFIAELDAVYAPTHFQADSETGAAHNCGHFTQVAIALTLYHHYFVTKAYQKLDFNLCFIFVPAEEYLDLDYRKSLRSAGKIQFLGGKPEAMRLGIFDEIDFGVCVHAIGELFTQPTIEINCDLAGFLYKKYHFSGKATHAGFDPFSGVNAYSISTLFNTAVGLSRQQFKDTESIRVNPIILASDMSTNVIPNRITVGTDLRCKTLEYMPEVARKLDHAAKGSAAALEGEVTIETEMGYLPFVQNRYLNHFVEKVFNQWTAIPDIIDNRGSIAAAGDIGDLSFMLPCIQVSYGGFKGAIHGDDFKMIDPEFVLQTFPEFLVAIFAEMSSNLDYSKFYKRTFAEYQELIDSMEGRI
ncbi:amidohydrolase [Enterococcus sp. PF1-24]|uniref:M20/M25/M40 family metallo-hydrolase n=1 Tax=unclassified Enterococcus TaxID=2608891 RepID=UPI002475E628|nr:MULTISPECIES: M20/M25/M40 family metallo-hydrolase [unclassified Enterococcus]MDH6363314.1 amidohydrolase [Enterococcus sp. PFB1-1]MDH6400385.1 amidohydrolase [Enterococcus sp. PF1-24]